MADLLEQEFETCLLDMTHPVPTPGTYRYLELRAIFFAGAATALGECRRTMPHFVYDVRCYSNQSQKGI